MVLYAFFSPLEGTLSLFRKFNFRSYARRLSRICRHFGKKISALHRNWRVCKLRSSRLLHTEN